MAQWVPPPQALSWGCNQDGIIQGCGLIWKLNWGRTYFWAHSHGCWQDSLPLGPLARGHSQFLVMWASLQGSSQHGSRFHQCQQIRVNESRARRKPWSFRNLIRKWHPSLCCNLLVRSESIGPACTQGKGLHKGMKTKRWDHWDHLRGHHRARMPGFHSQLC